MRLTVLQQQIKGFQKEQQQTGAAISKRVESIKHLLWHGNSVEALERLKSLFLDLDFMRNRSPQIQKLAKSVEELETYIRNNQESIPNYGERYRQGDRISTAFV